MVYLVREITSPLYECLFGKGHNWEELDGLPWKLHCKRCNLLQVGRVV